MSPRLQRFLFYAGLFGLWAWLAYMKFWPAYLFPSPKGVFDTLRQGFADHSFQIGIGRSLERIAIG
jgi:ABC-type nitrate/sulfonate/bicarbonate transport system permease component